MNSLNWKKVLISGVVFAVFVVMLAVGVYLVRKPQSQSVTSKAASNCPGLGWAVAPVAPTDGAANVSAPVSFSWSVENGANGTPNGNYTNAQIFKGYDGCAPSGVDFPASCQYGWFSRNASAPVTSASSTDFYAYDDPANNHVDYGKKVDLQCGKTYYWKAWFGDSCTGAMVPNYVWRFTMASCSQTVGCNQTCDATHLCPSSLSCDTVSGTCRKSDCSTQTSCVCPSAPTCDSMAMTPTCTVVTAGSETRSMTASGTGTDLEYTWNTTGGTLVMPGNEVGSNTVIWTAPANLGTTAQTWTISATVKDSINQVSTVGGCTKTLTYVPTPLTVTCNQACNTTTLLCPTGLSCDTVSGTCRKSECSTQTSCVCPTPAGACQRVTASKDLSTIKIGDTVTFTGFGTLSNPPSSDSIDKINFIISKDGAEASNTEVATTLDSAGVWKATKDFPITSPGSYSVRIRVHWLGTNKDVWLE